MRRTVLALGIVVLALSALPAGAGEEAATAGQEVIWPADQVVFKEVIPGVSKAILWGNPEKGAYGSLTRFAKGQRNPLHTHSNAIKIVVVSGTFVYDSGAGEKALGPGSYLLQPAGVKHVSGAGADADCLFFEESDGLFDLHPVE
jgi:quercetin dioxygenase-like cupin family protein